MATHSRILAWKIPWTEEPGGLQSMGSQRVEYNWVINTHFIRVTRNFSVHHSRRLHWWLRWLSICLQCGRPGFNPWVRKIPWRRKWQPTPVLLPVKFHGQRSLVGYSPWGCKELNRTEQLHSFIHSRIMSLQFSSVQSLSHVRLFVTPWTESLALSFLYSPTLIPYMTT